MDTNRYDGIIKANHGDGALRDLAAIAVNGRLDIGPERLADAVRGARAARENQSRNEDYWYDHEIVRAVVDALGMDYMRPVTEALAEAGFTVKKVWVNLRHTSVREQSCRDNRVTPQELETISRIKVSRGRVGKWVDLTDFDPVRIVNEAVRLFPPNEYTRLSDAFRACMGALLPSGQWLVYPTTYGIGVWVIFNAEANANVALVNRIVGEAGLDFENEYSDAFWVFRFRISKARENLARLVEYRGRMNAMPMATN